MSGNGPECKGTEIRTVQERDAPAIVDLLNPIIRAGVFTVLDRPMTIESQIEFIRSLPERGIYHVALDSDTGAVLGIQDVLPHATHTDALRHVGEISTFVSLDRQRAGVGTALTEATLAAADRLGFRKLLAIIRADNPQAIAFYEGQGFERIGIAREHALIGGEYVDEVMMERRLGGA